MFVLSCPGWAVTALEKCLELQVWGTNGCAMHRTRPTVCPRWAGPDLWKAACLHLFTAVPIFRQERTSLWAFNKNWGECDPPGFLHNKTQTRRVSCVLISRRRSKWKAQYRQRDSQAEQVSLNQRNSQWNEPRNSLAVRSPPRQLNVHKRTEQMNKRKKSSRAVDSFIQQKANVSKREITIWPNQMHSCFYKQSRWLSIFIQCSSIDPHCWNDLWFLLFLGPNKDWFTFYLNFYFLETYDPRKKGNTLPWMA